jgi:hypothetical protein
VTDEAATSSYAPAQPFNNSPSDLLALSMEHGALREGLVVSARSAAVFRLDNVVRLSRRRNARSRAIGNALQLDRRLPCSKRAVSIL